MKRLLIAEDEEVLRMLIIDTLEDEGYEIDEAADGQEAFQLIQSNDYHLVVLDYMMPLMTGLEVLEEVRKLSDKQQLKVLFLSAKNQQSDQERIFAAGADYFMSKPFSPITLAEKIGEILGD